MKTKAISILFALVMILSLSAGAFAQVSYDETWDEETVLSVFSELDIVFPDLFSDFDTDFLFVDVDSASIPDSFPKDASGSEYESKAPISTTDAPTMKASFAPCGDGLIKFDVTIHKAADAAGTVSGYYGPNRTTFIRSITAKVDGVAADIKKCTSTGGDNCRSVKFNSKGEAHIQGYVYAPKVLDSSAAPKLDLSIVHSTYMTVFGPVAKEAAINVSATAAADTKWDYCQTPLEEFSLGGQPAVQAKYDENTGEARFIATIRNNMSTQPVNYVIPADVLVDGVRYTDYTCKYKTFNPVNGAPYSDFCEYGEGIQLPPNGVIRFDITIDHIESETLLKYAGSDIPFTFRVGGMKKLMSGSFEAVPFPCAPETRMSVKDPLKPFMTFYGMETDPDIQPSGPYGVYDGGLWGIYQKCGNYAYMAVRLENDGIKDEMINLNNVSVSIAGGTPSDVKWVLSSVTPEDDKHVLLGPGQDVILICRVMVTPYRSQMNSDLAINGAVNFLDYGFYISGKVYSDHNNTNCVF